MNVSTWIELVCNLKISSNEHAVEYDSLEWLVVEGESSDFVNRCGVFMATL